jgi:hypothetical protein
MTGAGKKTPGASRSGDESGVLQSSTGSIVLRLAVGAPAAPGTTPETEKQP